MRFKLLGSAAGKTTPRPFCRCRVCDHARQHGGPDLRTRTGMRIFVDGDDAHEPKYQVDLPPDTGHHMVRDRVNLHRLEHLLITHTHEDHFDPLYLKNRDHLVSDRAAMPWLTIYGDEQVARLVGQLDMEFLKLRFVPVRAFEPFQADELNVLPLAGRHPAFNYVVTQGGKSTLLGWDTAWWEDPTWEAISKCRLDAAFFECTHFALEGKPKFNGGQHMDFQTLCRVRERLIEMGVIQARTPFVTVHMGDNGGLTHQERVNLAESKGFGVGYDGFELRVGE